MKEEKISPEWREFEKLVALIERHLSPKGATINSPDLIPDKITGELREVDASIRYQVGSVPLLITIECRKRASKEDSTWIEQLASKRDDIGASATVAVSSTGFSEPAIKKARFHGIETRLLQEVSEKAILDWARNIYFIVVRGSFGLGRLRVRFKSAYSNQQPELHPDIKAEYVKGDVEYKFIRRVEDNKLISIGYLMREAEIKAGRAIYSHPNNITFSLPPETAASIPLGSQYPSLFEDVPVGENPVTKVYAWTFKPNESTIETELGPMEIEYLDVELHVIQRAYPSNVGRLLSYKNDGELIAYVDERQLQIGKDAVMKVIISGNVDSNQ